MSLRGATKSGALQLRCERLSEVGIRSSLVHAKMAMHLHGLLSLYNAVDRFQRGDLAIEPPATCVEVQKIKIIVEGVRMLPYIGRAPS